MKSNNELGHLYVMRILSILCESWPKKVAELSCQQITGVNYDIESEFDFFTSPPDKRPSRPQEWDVCHDLFTWLENEGFIRKSSLSHDYHIFTSVEITAKAIKTFKELPDPLNPDSDHTMFDAIKFSSKEMASSAINTLTTAMITALT